MLSLKRPSRDRNVDRVELTALPEHRQHRTKGRVFYRPMLARHPHEEHRTATPLELFFDLCFVVAVTQAGDRLHHAISDGQFGHGVLGFVLVFFAIWWAWMNFSGSRRRTTPTTCSTGSPPWCRSPVR
jgi:hypothetical protein